MKKSLEDIDKFSEKIINFGRKIINWVINEKEKIELFKNNIEFHIKFNENIINLFSYDQLNYYSILNLQNLSFYLEEKDKLYSKVKIKELFYLIHDLELNYQNYNIEKNIHLNILNDKVKKFNYKNYNIQKNIHLNILNDKAKMNMWISNNYCSLKEGIREFLQNQYDAIILKITKKNLCVIPCGGTYAFNNFDTYINYSFENISENNKKYGEIYYDTENNILTMWNIGEINLGDLLLGSLKSSLNNPDIIGKFGEGMKLGILGLCRLKKRIKIISNQLSYTFYIKKIINLSKIIHLKNAYFVNMINIIKMIRII